MMGSSQQTLLHVAKCLFVDQEESLGASASQHNDSSAGRLLLSIVALGRNSPGERSAQHQGKVPSHIFCPRRTSAQTKFRLQTPLAQLRIILRTYCLAAVLWRDAYWHPSLSANVCLDMSVRAELLRIRTVSLVLWPRQALCPDTCMHCEPQPQSISQSSLRMCLLPRCSHCCRKASRSSCMWVVILLMAGFSVLVVPVLSFT